MAKEEDLIKMRPTLSAEKNVAMKIDELDQESKLLQELGIIQQDDSKTGQAKLKNMWNKIRTKIMMEYILLIDNILIALWFGIMVINIYDVRVADTVLH